ncbi:MAG: DNA internalization-related competence protein ComEC/Rec2 [Ezakiella sp.]|uniref:DNA internalization-related competence protein ComEC/Rec2 n=1 Tax=Ezakiella sp. TaxID=1935205 RepID=UPI002A91A9E5|nr:DNA internalization-related competence protein ComEC/Rec2 [Ezakiella sp.]MDY6079450.1 DNA internalization-related competence protein ComEC/Rec2 [Ezakiella sp.]
MGLLLSSVIAILITRYLYLALLIPFLLIYLLRNYKSNKTKYLIVTFLFVFFFIYSGVRYDFLNSSNTGSGLVYNKTTTEFGARYYIRNSLLNKTLLYSEDDSIEEGDIVKYKGEVSDFFENTMPLLFNEKIYYNSIGINNKIKKCELNYVRDSFFKPLFNLKSQFRNEYEKSLNENAYYLSSGAILRKTEDNIIYDKMEFAGLSHILSTSGLHVAIIYGFLFFIIGLIIPSLKPRVFISLLIIWIYGFMLVFPPSLLRALIMITILEISRIYFPNISNKKALLIAFELSLFINPYYIFNISFILSYLCMFGIIFIRPHIRNSLKNRGNYIVEYFALNISIILATFPVVIYFFNRYNIFSIIWNFIFIPIFSIYINISFLFLLISKISILNNIVSVILNIMANGIDYMLTITSFNFSRIVFPSPNIFAIIIYYFAIYIYLNRTFLANRLYREIRRLMPILVGFTIMFVVFNRDYDFVQFLDVGQGDAALIHVDHKNYLIDSGGDLSRPGFVGKNILEPYLIKNGFRNIEAGFITHFDYDHYGGFTEVSDDINIKFLVSDHMPTEIEEDINLDEFIKKVIQMNRKNIEIGGKYKLVDMVYEKSSDFENNASLVLKLVKDDINIALFSGDIESEAEDKLLESDLNSFILKVSHHGSKTSSTEEFLKRVSPKYAIISVGRNNRYGHPNDVVLKRIENICEVYRTDKDGLVTFDLENYKIYSYLNKKNYFNYVYILIVLIASFYIVEKVGKRDELYKFFEKN